MNKNITTLVPASLCMAGGLLLKDISPNLGLTIFVSSFYFLGNWKHYQLHPNSDIKAKKEKGKQYKKTR